MNPRNIPLPTAPARGDGTDDLLPTRRSLLGRLKDWGDSASWQRFFDTYWQLIYNVACKAGLSPAEAEEVVQETVLSVAKAMKDFRYDPARGSFKGWLLQLTGWRITNQLKKRGRLGSSTSLSNLGGSGFPGHDEEAYGMSVAPELEALWDAEWEQNTLRSAMEEVRTRVTAKQYQIFDLYVVQQKSAREVAEFLGVSTPEVYLTKHRVGRMVRAEIARLQQRLY